MASMTQDVFISDVANSPIRALHSLRGDQASSILVGLKCFDTEWDLEQHESCDGHLSLVLVHLSQDRTIIVSQDRAGLQISVMQEDKFQTGMRPYTSIGEVIETIKALAGSQKSRCIRHIA